MNRQTDATDLGAILGICNAFVIAIGLAAKLDSSNWLDMTVVIFVVGLVPSMVVGFVLGAIAGRTSEQRRWVRLVVLTVPALATVWGLSCMFDLSPYFTRAAIPTLVATLLLERFTRAQSLLPTGIVHRA
jgi:hypothetical protein